MSASSSPTSFDASGAYVWYFSAPDELVGAEADGWMAERLRNARLKLTESPVTGEAIHRRKTVCANTLKNTSHYPPAAEFSAKSSMATPVLAYNEVVGAIMFVHGKNGYTGQNGMELVALLGTLSLALVLAGAGRYSLDARMGRSDTTP